MDDSYITPAELLLLEGYLGSLYYLSCSVVVAWFLVYRYKLSIPVSLGIAALSFALAILVGIVIWTGAIPLGYSQVPGFSGMSFFHMPAIISSLVIAAAILLVAHRKRRGSDAT